jgi:peroxiredoxin
MMQRVLRTLAFTILLSACGAAMPASYARNPLSPHGAEMKPLPEFKRPTIGGGAFDSTEARGKVVVVKFFAKYCVPCKTTLPWFEKLSRERRDVVFVGISEDDQESETQELVQMYGLTFPVVRDSGNALSGRFRVTEMPITFVADPTGRIRWVGGPGQTEDELEAAVSASQR